MGRTNSHYSYGKIIIAILCLSILVAGGIPGVRAEESKSETAQISERMKSIIGRHESTIKEWAADSILVAAVTAQNTKKMSLEEIKRIDDEWMKGKQENFASELQENESGKFLKNKIRSNELLYTEAFLCDNQGAVVGEYPKTSDYWQGDEDKFIQCFNNGSGKTFTGPAAFDDSTKTISVQISVPVLDKGQTIGVLIVGLKNVK